MKKLEVLTESVLKEMDVFMDNYKGTQEQSDFARLVLEDYNKTTNGRFNEETFSHEEVHLLLAVMYAFTCQKQQKE
jgi:hypothetical protein